MTKILHICTYDSMGGAGRACCRLHHGLRAIGVDSKLLALYCYSREKDIFAFAPNDNFLRRQFNKARKMVFGSNKGVYIRDSDKDGNLFTGTRTLYRIEAHPFVQESDVISLHWIAGMVDFPGFFSRLNKPVIWTLHDMNPFTGGCHHSGKCRRYETGCGACPYLGSSNNNDLSRRIWLEKKKCYKKHAFRIATPSRWLAECAKKSLLFRDFDIETIPGAVPTDIFANRDKSFSRQLLGLPKDKILVFFSAAFLSKQKGFFYLLEALRRIGNTKDSSQIALVVSGLNFEKPPGDLGVDIYPLPYIHDELLLACCYSAVDFIVVPSLRENFPNTILESFACGRPVVASDVGGVAEMVVPYKTGLLVNAGDPDDLKEKIIWMIEHPLERESMGICAREIIENGYTPLIQANKYMSLLRF